MFPVSFSVFLQLLTKSGMRIALDKVLTLSTYMKKLFTMNSIPLAHDKRNAKVWLWGNMSKPRLEYHSVR